MITAETTPLRPTVQNRAPEFFHRLESLRGLAALMVAAGHSFLVLAPSGALGTACQLAVIPFNGHAAVTLFFVLSGLVLGRSLARESGPQALTYGLFVARRVFRICPAFLVACLLIAAAIYPLQTLTPYPLGVSNWFGYHWCDPINGKLLLRNLLFLAHNLNPPSWTLRAELVCSSALPLLFFLSAGGPWPRYALLLAGLMLWPLFRSGNLSAFLFMFYLGLLVPTAGPVLMRWLARCGRVAFWVAPVTWLIICECHDAFEGLPWENPIEGVTAAFFLCALLYGPELPGFRIFDWPITRFYGQISYSFYLYHMPCLYLVVQAIFKCVPLTLLLHHALLSAFLWFLLSTALATLLSWASYRLIELPGMDLGKRCCRWAKSRLLTCWPASP